MTCNLVRNGNEPVNLTKPWPRYVAPKVRLVASGFIVIKNEKARETLASSKLHLARKGRQTCPNPKHRGRLAMALSLAEIQPGR